MQNLELLVMMSARQGLAHMRHAPNVLPSHPIIVLQIVYLALQDELKYLEDRGFQEESYAYVACMAVDPEARRSGAASALLGAAERMAGKWQQNWVLLHVYTDNFPGLRLYHRNGCEPIQ